MSHFNFNLKPYFICLYYYKHVKPLIKPISKHRQGSHSSECHSKFKQQPQETSRPVREPCRHPEQRHRSREERTGTQQRPQPQGRPPATQWRTHGVNQEWRRAIQTSCREQPVIHGNRSAPPDEHAEDGQRADFVSPEAQ